MEVMLYISVAEESLERIARHIGELVCFEIQNV